MYLQIVIILGTFVASIRPQEGDSEKCFSVACVKSAATIIEKIDTHFDPCDGKKKF